MSKNLPLLLTSLALVITLVIAALGLPILLKPKPGEMIKAHIFLENACGITDDAFVLLVPSSGKRIAFANGEIKLILKAGEPLRLIASPAYPKVRYDGYTEPAARNTTMTVQCNPSDFENSINNPLRKQFGG